MAVDVPDWTGKQTVTIDTSGGPVQVSQQGTVTAEITGDVSVQGVAGGTAVGVTVGNTVDVNLTGASATVTVAGTVTADVSGTVTVQGVAGGTAVGVNVGNLVDVNVTGSSATLDVQFPSAQDVTINSDAPVQISNDVVPTTDGVVVSGTQGIAGTSTYINPTIPDAYYDAVTLLVYAPNADLANFTFTLSQVRYQNAFGHGEGGTYVNISEDFVPSGQSDNPGLFMYYLPIRFAPTPGTDLEIHVVSSVSTTETLEWQVKLHYASVNVANPTSGSVNVQPGQGSWDTQTAFAQSGLNNQTATLLSAGGQIKTLYLSYGIVATSAGVVEITQNGTIIDRISVGANSSLYEHELIQLSPDGVTLSGTGIQIVVPNGMTVAVSGYGTYASSTPPSRVGSIV